LGSLVAAVTPYWQIGMSSGSYHRLRVMQLASLIAATLALVLGGCASIPRNGVPNAALAQEAQIPDMNSIRFWGDEVSLDPIGDIRKHAIHMPRIAQNAKRIDGRPVIETLALSGGGSDGAFGAGVLAGWTARGDRPEFEVVTGVSAGAIIAPFAFLGSKYDNDLKTIWTDYQQSQVVTTQVISGLFGGDALTDTTPLANLIAKYVDQKMLDEIAAQYRRGRILMVLTTNLDAQRPVTWNMGEIARSRSPRALALFRKVILASAAIPGAFPPVNIEVEAGGKQYDELHVDGGTTREVFVLPVDAPFKAFDALYAKPPIRKLYIIKNGKIVPEYEIVPQKTLKIASRSIFTLTKSQNWSEVYRIYREALDADADFNFLAVPASFNHTSNKIYDPAYQKALYNVGVKVGRSGNWSKTPPGQTPISFPTKVSPTPSSRPRPQVSDNPPSVAPSAEHPAPRSVAANP
jgi:hypothetical protein